jgi:hypothetical protein
MADQPLVLLVGASALQRQMARSMIFRIDTEPRGNVTVFILSGRLAQSAVAELKRLFELHTDYLNIALDLKDVRAVDREAVRFLIGCEADGVTLAHCTPYIREWMEREQD